MVSTLLVAGCQPEDPVPHLEDTRQIASPELIGRLQGGRPAEQVRTALAMGRIQHPSYVEALSQAAQAESPTELRVMALFALGQLGLATAVELPELATLTCREALDDSDPQIVAAAAEALGKLAPQGVEALLTPQADHEDPRVRAEVAMALFRFRFARVWRRQVTEPPPLAPGSRDALTARFQDPDAAVRQAAVYGFSRYPDPGIEAELVEAAQDEQPWVRLFAIRALGRAGQRSPAVVAALRSALGDADAKLRSEAVSALAAVGAAAELSEDLAVDPSFHVRAALAAAQAEGQARLQTLPLLRALEGDPSPAVRAQALGTLSQRLDSGYAADLKRHLEDRSWVIRRAAATAAGAQGDRQALEDAMDDPDSRVQAAALRAWGGTPGLDVHLQAALAADDLAIRGTAVSLLPQDSPDRLSLLGAAYQRSEGDGWIEVREGIVDAWAASASSEEPSLGDAARDALRAAAEADPAFSVRAKARAALRAAGESLPAATAHEPTPSRLLGTAFAADPRVRLETSKGTLTLRCLAQEAPIHVAQFVENVRGGFYDGLIFHRVVPNFVIQGGDPRGDGWGSGGLVLRDEINRVRFERGMVGMPKAGKDTGGCQIFITHVPTPHLDGNYTIFAQVVEGLDVIDQIEVGDKIVQASVVP